MKYARPNLSILYEQSCVDGTTWVWASYAGSYVSCNRSCVYAERFTFPTLTRVGFLRVFLLVVPCVDLMEARVARSAIVADIR